jgi:protein-disulfide isomerase
MTSLDSSKTNPWFGLSMVLVGVIVGYSAAVIFGGASLIGPSDANDAPTPPPSAPSVENVVPVSKKTDHIRGDVNAEISIIEYSDFECPYCERHHATVQQLVDQYDGKVNWVYRHFPLGNHPNAQKAAEAVVCSANINDNETAWKMIDMLFERGPTNSNLVTYAKELGIDESKFQDCLDTDKYQQFVKNQANAGQNSGITGTPGNIILNNKTKESRVVSGARPVDSFSVVIDELLD